MTHQLDALRAERRQLPRVKIETPYVFQGVEGNCTLGDLFRGRSQIAIINDKVSASSSQSAFGPDEACGCDALTRQIRQGD